MEIARSRRGAAVLRRLEDARLERLARVAGAGWSLVWLFLAWHFGCSIGGAPRCFRCLSRRHDPGVDRPRSLRGALGPRITQADGALGPTIKSEIAAGRIALDPFDETMVQPSSVDVRVDRSFRVFHNARYPFIDVRQPMEELTELVEISDADPFILHPGEFVLGQTLERVGCPTTSSRGSRARARWAGSAC